MAAASLSPSLLAACFALAAATTAVAEDVAGKAVGTYEQKGDYWQKVKIEAGPGRGRFVGSFDVASRGCQGDVTMPGRASGTGAILFSGPSDLADGGVCRIRVTSSDNFATITVKHPFCGLSGAACDFNGTLKRSRGR